MSSKNITTDFIVIGSGIAGLWFAHKVSEFGQVCILTKKEDTESNTNYAQGGIAAAFGIDDAPAMHIQDTIRAGKGLAKSEVVRMVCEQGPKLIQELYDAGIKFTTYYNTSGALHYDLGREGGHSRARIIHAKDFTGREIEQGLINALKNRCQFFEHNLVFNIILSENKNCIGVQAIDTKSGMQRNFFAKAVLLATGGVGQVYLHTTNPKIATGDGIALAYNAGAKIANMEFIQFHPTALYGHKINDRYFLISEAVRGEGGMLRTQDGKTFMENYHELGCLAPRDVVARAIDNELKKAKQDYVLLDVTHLDPEKIKARFPNIYKTCLDLDIDITKQPIPVVPAAHYVCGGIVIDECGKTDIPYLFAVGECAHSGLHGANRLASNSLLEALVFAERAAVCVHNYLNINIKTDGKNLMNLENINLTDNLQIAEQTDRLKRVMWEGAGIIRSNHRLQNAIEQVKSLIEESNQLQPISPDLIELKNMLIVAWLIVQSALMRKESRGLHYNEDFPDTDDENFLRDTIIQK